MGIGLKARKKAIGIEPLAYTGRTWGRMAPGTKYHHRGRACLLQHHCRRAALMRPLQTAPERLGGEWCG